MKRGTSWILVALVLAGWTARAGAEPEAAVVAVLPLAAADEHMRIYGPPVAGALAERLGSQRGLRVEALSLSGVLPAQVDLVIDGRIVTAPSGEVLLEARVRDPERGITVAAVATGARPLTEIDRLSVDLAAALAPRLRAASAAIATRRQAAPAPAEPDGTGQDAAARTRSQPGGSSQDQPPAAASHGARDTMLVFGAGGQAAGGTIPVEPHATRAAHRLASRLGHRPVAAAARGLVSPADTAQALGETGATHALMLQVQDIEFAWSSVLMARGRVRVVLIDAGGRAVYDRTHRTGTLVGNRGDRHTALVRLVMDQVTDVFAPEMRRVLAAPTRARAGAPGSR